MKVALAIFIVLMGAVFLWKPLTMPFSGAVIHNDFVLQTTGGALDSKALRGKVLAVVFAYADCGDACNGRVVKLAKAYDQLSAGERAFVRLVLISADPARDTPERITEYAGRFHPDIAGVTGKPEEIQVVADGFAAVIQKDALNGNRVTGVSPLIYIVDAEGRFASVLNDNIPPESVAQSLRSRIPPQLPPVR